RPARRRKSRKKSVPTPVSSCGRCSVTRSLSPTLVGNPVVVSIAAEAGCDVDVVALAVAVAIDRNATDLTHVQGAVVQLVGAVAEGVVDDLNRHAAPTVGRNEIFDRGYLSGGIERRHFDPAVGIVNVTRARGVAEEVFVAIGGRKHGRGGKDAAER